MTKYQRVVSRAFKAVELNHKENEAAFADNPAMVEACDKLKAVNGELATVLQKQVRGSKPDTAERDVKEIELIKSLRVVFSYVYAVAVSREIESLKVLTNYSKSALENMPVEQLAAVSKNVLTEVRNYGGDLAAKGFSPSDADSFEAQVGDFILWMDAPRRAINNRKAGTRSVPKLLRDGTAIINKEMVGLMLKYEDSHPKYFAQFHTAKKRVNVAVKHEAEAAGGGTVIV